MTEQSEIDIDMIVIDAIKSLDRLLLLLDSADEDSVNYAEDILRKLDASGNTQNAVRDHFAARIVDHLMSGSQ